MKKVLVTGAGGYIGRHVVTNLLDRGYDVIASDVNVENIDDRAMKIQDNIFSRDRDIFVKLNRPDICIHLAWKDGFIHNSNAHIENLSDHYIFLKNMIEGGLKHVSIMGTMHEIGYYEGVVNETTPCNPISLYGIAKDALRNSMMLFLKGKDVTFQWLRAYYIYGDDRKNNSIFAKIIEAEEDGKKYFPFTMGKNKYDFITVDELAKQITASSIQDEVCGVINCCSGEAISLSDKVESFIEENKFSIKLQYGFFPEREYDSPAIWGDSSKIEKILKNKK